MTELLRSSRRAILLTLAVLLGVLTALTGCRKKHTSPAPTLTNGTIRVGGDGPLSAQRLKGARLGAIQSTTTWDFTDTRFTLLNRDGPLPANVVASVLGPGTASNRVEGDWRFDGQAGLLILSNMESDGQKVDTTASLPIHAAGAVRANLGTEQYNIFPPEMVRRLDRALASPSDKR